MQFTTLSESKQKTITPATTSLSDIQHRILTLVYSLYPIAYSQNKKHMKQNLLKSVILSVTLLMGVSNAWAWYVPGTIHETRWDKADNNMHEDNAITFYAVPAGTYEFQLTDGSNWSGNGCIAEAAGVTTGTNGNNATITTTETRDITITVIDGANKKVSVTTSAPTYHVKAKWDGTYWSWKEFHNQGDGTYSLLNTYTNSKEYNYIKISSDDDAHKEYKDNATLVNSPSSTSDNCIYTFNPSDGSLEIRKCNTVTQPFHIYFDNSNANWSNTNEDIKFIIGHTSYSRAYPLSGIENTKLFYIYMNRGDGTAYNWPDAGYYAMMEKHGTWYNGYNEGYWGRKYLEYATKHSKAYLEPYNMIPNHSYILETTNTETTSPITITDKGANGLPNTTQTIKYALSEYGGTPAIMNSGTTPAKITMSSYKFVSGTYNAVSAEKPSDLTANGTTYSQTFTAAQTATTTLTVSEIVAGYKFIGWYTETGKPLSQSSTYTYYPTSNTTIYARFEYRSTVNYMESHGGKITVTYTDQNGDTQTKELSPNQPFDIATGGVLNFTARANEGYTFRRIYVKRPNHVYTNNLSDTVIVNSNITIIPEFTHNSDSKIVFLDLNTKLPVTDPNTSDENRYWTKGGAYFKVHYDGSDHDIQDWDINNKLYYHNQHVAAGKVLIFKRYGNDDKLKNSSPTIVTADDLNKYAIIGKAPASWTEGEWREGPTYQIKLVGNNYGHFAVKYKNDTYTSKSKEDGDVTFRATYGSTFEIVESQHNYPNTFNGDLDIEEIGGNRYNLKSPVGKQLTVLSDINIYENFVVRTEAVADKKLHIFFKIPKSLDKKIEGNEVGWHDNDNTDGSPTPGYSTTECANFIWLGMTKYTGQTIQGSTEEDRGCPGTGQPAGSYLLRPLLVNDATHNIYYCTITDSCWVSIKFERKHADSDPNSGQLMAAEVQRFAGDGRVCFRITGYDNEKGFIGVWEEAPKCKVELGYTDIGRFGVKYKGETVYEEKTKEEDGNRDETYVYVDFKDEIEIVDADPGNDAFAKSLVYIDETGKKTKLDFSEQNSSYTYQITGDVKVDDLFGTKQNYTIYIGIPKNQDGFEDWDLACTDPNHNGDQMYIWCHWPYGGFGGYENYGNNELIKRTTSIETEEMIYYQFELPQGVYAFAFQCKENKDKDNSSKEHATSVYQYNPPLTTADCFVLDGGKSGINGTDYTGYWTSMPSDGDFRLLYVEQEVIKAEDADGDAWLTKVNRTYEHSSDIVKPHELNGKDKIVSLHIYTRGQNPEVILQKYSDQQKKWVDIEAHMVNGPLETDDPGMGLLPGRKNAGPGSEVDDFVYDDGIEKIKNDDQDDGCGVWNFTIIKDGNNAKLDLVNGLERYTGKYYIRTTNAEGEWINYTLPSNHMTFSPYAKQHHGEYFSHYFCKWVDIKKHYRDVSFIIANDHAQNLTDPSSRFVDNYVDNQWLPENANIRWGWSIINNKVSRAYIAGSYDGQNEFLVVNGNDTKVQLQNNINGEKGYFNDNTNWLYYADLGAQPEAQVKVTAKYNAKYQYFMGTADEYQKLIGGNFAQDQRYHPIRILYDFKEHRFVVGYHPESQIGQDVAIETPVMLIRRHHDAPNQITFDNTARKIEAPMPAYGVITFLENKLKDPNISNNEKMFYWVSFPFDVKISHVFGLGNYGSHWVMEEYDGEARAKEGWNIYNTFWRYITDTTRTLEAGKGYVLCLNYNRIINEAFLSGEDEEVSLYFPSVVAVDQSTIQSRGEKEVPIPTWTGAAPQKDHNWNLIGAISYANTGEKTQQSNSKFLYEYQPANDTYSPRASNGYTFNALHAYMVQYAGTITWTSHIAPLSIAAKRDAENDDNMHELSLDLILNGTTQDQTFIQLEDGEATQMFDLNIDMTKIINSGSNIYSISDDNNKLAGNVIPIEETIIPLGIKLDAAGEYTFAMPNGTDGIVVELIDYETNTRTNMLLDNYTVNLGKGTFENRFALHVKPNKTTTSIVDVNTNSSGVRKFIIDGTLYMKKDGVLYDAQGRCVQ